MLAETQEHPAELKNRVTTPGGTTAAGLHALEQGGLRATLTEGNPRRNGASKRTRLVPNKFVTNWTPIWICSPWFISELLEIFTILVLANAILSWFVFGTQKLCC